LASDASELGGAFLVAITGEAGTVEAVLRSGDRVPWTVVATVIGQLDALPAVAHRCVFEEVHSGDRAWGRVASKPTDRTTTNEEISRRRQPCRARDVGGP
jgi:hypothetical protein